jgi:dTDP-4-amino-4,6-dideoxygalactose transaminase
MNEISTGVHYPIPVHRQPAYQEYQNNVGLTFTDQWSNTVLSIPIYPGLDFRDQEYVLSLIEKFYYDRLYESEQVKEAQLEWSKKLV